MRLSYFASIAACLLFSTNVLAADTGESVYKSVCLACHGPGAAGNASLRSPALAGQNSAYVVRQLSNFKNSLRGAHQADTPGKQMVAISASLSPESMQMVADYVAALPAVKVKTSAGNVKEGEKYYQSYCGSCHGSEAQGNDALNSPRLTGIDAVYLTRQYQYFLDGVRGTEKDDKFGRQMSMMAKAMSDPEQVANVMAWITAQK